MSAADAAKVAGALLAEEESVPVQQLGFGAVVLPQLGPGWGGADMRCMDIKPNEKISPPAPGPPRQNI